jgi:NADH-quinone oxidoreductase subunit N
LVGIRKKHLQSNESAFKYVVNGGISTAVLLFGMSYVYGITGTTNLYEIAETMQSSAFAAGYGPIIYVAFFFIFVGLSFKIASAPFHMWAPDVYQGAPTPVTAFLSVVSKAAGFAILTRVFMTSFAWLTDMEESMPQMFLEEVSIYLAVIAAVTMIVGNVMALRQINVKRMFAFSSIAQAGYILVPLAVANPLMLDEMVFYLIVYLLMNLGAFAVILAVTTDRGTDELRAFAGLYHRSPLMAVAMTIFLISLAGIPITGGFFGKLYIFLGTLWAGNYWLAGIMVATSVISYYYYFGIIRQMYMRPGDTEARINVPVSLAIVLIIGLIGTIVTGFFPNTILDYIQTEFDSETMFQMFNR